MEGGLMMWAGDSVQLARPTGAGHVQVGSDQERQMVVEAEALLWSCAARRDQERLEWLLHHDYSGVTRDGDPVSREDAVAATSGAAPRGERDFTQWTFHPMPWPLVLATYRLAEDQGTSRHISVWDVSTGLARLRFHQGTWVAHDAQ